MLLQNIGVKNVINNNNIKCVTNLCEVCKTGYLDILSKYLQVKTSEGVTHNSTTRKFSFHPKIRYNMGQNMFYVWIAIFTKDFLQQHDQDLQIPIIHFYIFNSKDVSRFDDINLDTYQITDNQKTELPIDKEGNILKVGKKHNYDCFKEFHNNFTCLDIINKE